MLLIRSLFFCLLILCLVILGLFFIDAPEGITGFDHPDIPGMRHSYEGLYLEGPVAWLAVLYGIGIVAVLSICVGIGYQKKEKLGLMKPVVIFGTIGYLIVYGILVWLYWQYERGMLTDIWFGLPVPTAWMVYIMWFFPVIFTIFYVMYFHKWILTKEDFQRFSSLVKQGVASNAESNQEKQ